MKLIKAIKTAYRLKDGKLNVKYHSSYTTYDWHTDTLYIEYANAMNILSQHRIVRWILRKLGMV
ncbi:hypothetical protein LCGC14_0890050 [marine sediment metagenome]|uniref:Uncharacterized protein n=1 Tax=marine sediment metagenome TaxID=412755 RepID=A0A0F9NZJ6_9ZZZZ